MRISQEVSTLATSLPVQPDSSIFLRVDENRFDVMRAMITGPKGTPYEVGCGVVGVALFWRRVLLDAAFLCAFVVGVVVVVVIETVLLCT